MSKITLCMRGGGGIRVVDVAYNLVKPAEIVISDEIIKIKTRYPIKKTFSRTFHCEDGFTRHALFDCIQEAYRMIYREPMRYGIWGHGMDDLFIEEVSYDEEKKVASLFMGS